MGATEIGFFRGAGGIVFDFYLPLSENQQHKVTRGELVRVNEDGSPYGTDSTPKRPADSALKAEWVGYALAVDKNLTVDDADAMTKNDLIEKYGK
jgi:hypothetical protein